VYVILKTWWFGCVGAGAGARSYSACDCMAFSWLHRGVSQYYSWLSVMMRRNVCKVVTLESYLVDPASSHMLVSKIKPCMSKFKRK
jgi:hypothetical protein